MRQARLILPLSPRFIVRELLTDPRSDDKLRARLLKLLAKKSLGWRVMRAGRPSVDSDVGALRRVATNKSVDPAVRFAALKQVIEGQ